MKKFFMFIGLIFGLSASCLAEDKEIPGKDISHFVSVVDREGKEAGILTEREADKFIEKLEMEQWDYGQRMDAGATQICEFEMYERSDTEQGVNLVGLSLYRQGDSYWIKMDGLTAVIPENTGNYLEDLKNEKITGELTSEDILNAWGVPVIKMETTDEEMEDIFSDIIGELQGEAEETVDDILGELGGIREEVYSDIQEGLSGEVSELRIEKVIVKLMDSEMEYGINEEKAIQEYLEKMKPEQWNFMRRLPAEAEKIMEIAGFAPERNRGTQELVEMYTQEIYKMADNQYYAKMIIYSSEADSADEILCFKIPEDFVHYLERICN